MEHKSIFASAREILEGKSPVNQDESYNNTHDDGGYIESMGPKFDKGFDMVVSAWNEWKKGPMTEREHIAPAKKEILEYLASKLK